MKKILLLLSFLFLLNIGKSQTNINVWGGYSWINGLIGIETQYGHFGVGAGYMPTKMPYYGDNIPSWAGSVTYYTKYKENFNNYNLLDICYYGSIGVASAAYRYQDINFNEEVLAMTYGMVGIKGYKNKFSFKTGVGYGWCKEKNNFTFEIGISYTILSNN